jgi:hydrogenase nickel incorporation protein HypA/HybF
MHEVSVIQNLLEHVQKLGEEYRLVRVTKVVVRIGDQVCLCRESLSFAFDAACRGTIAEGAEFLIENVPGIIRCLRCDFQPDTGNAQPFGCSRCGGPLEVVAGRELDLQTIEGDQEEPSDED